MFYCYFREQLVDADDNFECRLNKSENLHIMPLNSYLHCIFNSLIFYFIIIKAEKGVCLKFGGNFFDFFASSSSDNTFAFNGFRPIFGGRGGRTNKLVTTQ